MARRNLSQEPWKPILGKECLRSLGDTPENTEYLNHTDALRRVKHCHHNDIAAFRGARGK